ncbi:MAG: hypothetical protein WAQ57_01205 [Candidatus Saccharimonadales bacterium]
MAKITVEDDDKVMDVAKPGKGKIVGTSRPVIAPITSDQPNKTAVPSAADETSEAAAAAPSVAKKVIQPITAPEKDPAAEDKPGEAAEAPAADAPGAEDNEAAPAGRSEAAEVNALADQMKSKKEEAAKAEERAKQDAALQELVDSKKYFVPVGKAHAKSSRSALWLVPLLIVAALAAAYILIDAGLVDVNITLPFELIK